VDNPFQATELARGAQRNRGCSEASSPSCACPGVEARLRELISSAATQPGHVHAEVLPAPALTDRRTTSSSIGSPNPAIDNR
jgi:hypothetical protein